MQKNMKHALHDASQCIRPHTTCFSQLAQMLETFNLCAGNKCLFIPLLHISLSLSLSLSLSCGLQGSIRLTLPTGSDLWTPHYAAVPRPTLANFGGETHGSYLECWGCTQSTEGCPDLPSYGAWHFSYEHMKNPCPMGFVQVLTMVQ